MAGSETLTNGARSRWPSRAVLAVAGLVVASTAIRFAAAQAFTTPWIAPDEMVYGMLGEGLWSRFNAGKVDQLWFYRSVVQAVRSRDASGFLVEELDRVVSELDRLATQTGSAT